MLVTVLVGWIWAIPFWLTVLFVVQFFRDPKRHVPQQAGIVVCPADGRVVYVGPAQDPYLQRSAVKISIFMNVFNVHSNRSPVSGSVEDRWYTPGKFINAELDKASQENERNALKIKDESGLEVVCVQVAGLIARRILCYVDKGDRIDRGERYGFIRFGSRVDLYLPINSVARVGLGDKVSAGCDIAADLPT